MFVYKKYIKQLEHLNSFRDHLEHIDDGRLDGIGEKSVPLKNPKMLGNLFYDNYDFGGETFSLKEAEELYFNIKYELESWNNKTSIFPIPFQ